MPQNDITATGRLVPTIRFKGFTDDWEQRKFGEMAEYKKGPFGSALKKELFVPDGHEAVKVYEQQNAINKDWHLERYYISKDYANQLKAFETHAGDIIVSCAGTIGEMYELPLNARPGIINQALMRVRVNEKMVRKNVFKLLFSNMIDNFSKEFSNGSAMKNIPPFADLKPMEAFVPALREQRLIDDFFASFTALITLHQHKLGHEKKLKKYLLQNMFPREGENVPRIRFPGFTDPWEQRKLSSLFESFVDGDWIEAKDQSDSGIRLIQTGNVGITNFIDKPDNKKWISEDTFESLHCEEIYPGDILISRLPEPAGRACIVPVTGTRMITAVDCTIARTSSNNSAEFIVQYLSTPDYFKWVNSCLAGGTRQRISRSMLSDCNIMIPPTLDEQDKIGRTFSLLDNLITLHQRKLESLKELKKGLLQKMFV